jgi:DNA-binding NarL/FixJ family response regulator
MADRIMDRVLIVEDDLIIQKLIEYRLAELGYSVCGKAETGEGAIFSAMSMKPDVILMDINLKGTVDGIDAANTIRKSLSSRIIFLTAMTDDAIIRRVKEMHPDGFILKPFNDTDLRVALALAHADPVPLPVDPLVTPSIL